MRHDANGPTMRYRWPILLAALGCLACPAAADYDDSATRDEAVHDGYEDGAYARVRYQENGLSIERATTTDSMLADDDEEDDGHNTPLFPGDAIETAADERAEVELSGGTLVRVDRGTELTFLALPDPYAEIADSTVLQLEEGVIRIAAVLGDDEELRVDTPASSIYVAGDGDVRIEVDSRGTTRVFSRRGVTEVVGSGGSVLLRGGTQTTVHVGSTPERAYSFNTFVADGFDRWVDDREGLYRAPERDTIVYRELPQEVRPYYAELSTHGSWVREDSYGWVWVPSDVRGDWRPYYDGHWSSGPHGWFWVSDEPWGWAPYHYGRWEWVGHRGWCWIPGRVFAGAWVAWSWGSVHVGWAPLGYWNRPCHVTTLVYDRYCPRSWTFVDYHHVHHHHARRYAVRVSDVGDELARAAVGTRAPRVHPRELATSAEARSAAVREASVDARRRGAAERRAFSDVERADRTDRIARVSRSNRGRAVATVEDGGTAARVGRPDAGERSAARRDSSTDSRRTATAFPRRITSAPGESRTVDGATSPRREAVRTPPAARSTERLRDLYRDVGRTPRTREAEPSEREVGERGVEQAAPAEPRSRAATPLPRARSRSNVEPAQQDETAPEAKPADPPERSEPRPTSPRSTETTPRSTGRQAGGGRGDRDRPPAATTAPAPAPRAPETRAPVRRSEPSASSAPVRRPAPTVRAPSAPRAPSEPAPSARSRGQSRSAQQPAPSASSGGGGSKRSASGSRRRGR